MATSQSPRPQPVAAQVAIAARLRAAGCVFAEDEARLLVSAARTPSELESLVARRAAGQPLEHLLGWAEFCGLRIIVDPGVFVPRRRTEFLVHQAIACLQQAAARAQQAAALAAESTTLAQRRATPADLTATPSERAVRPSRRAVGTPGQAFDRPLTVLDLCCGTGAVGAALVAAMNHIELHAADIDPAAVRCARRNLAASGAQVHQGDLDEPLPDGLRSRVDVLVANAPYVPTDAIPLMPPEARLYEAHVALDGGVDGLDIQRRIAAAAPHWLAPGGQLLIETSQRQAPQTVDAFARNGLIPRIASSDELDATVVIGTKPATSISPPPTAAPREHCGGARP